MDVVERKVEFTEPRTKGKTHELTCFKLFVSPQTKKYKEEN